MEFEATSDYGEAAWVSMADEVEFDDDEIIVDDFLWPLLNALASGQDVRGSEMLAKMNEALISKDETFVYRLGNLGMTYEPELIPDAGDDEILETDSFAEMLSKLRTIYVLHEEEQAVQLLDMFMARASPCVILHMPLDTVL